jgi:hypothetical protein
MGSREGEVRGWGELEGGTKTAREAMPCRWVAALRGAHASSACVHTIAHTHTHMHACMHACMHMQLGAGGLEIKGLDRDLISATV